MGALNQIYKELLMVPESIYNGIENKNIKSEK